MRIYELAKKHNISSKNLMEILDSLKITYKTHSSSVPEDKISQVEEKIKKGSSAEEKPKASPKKKETPKEEKAPKKEKTVKKSSEKPVKHNKETAHKQNEAKEKAEKKEQPVKKQKAEKPKKEQPAASEIKKHEAESQGNITIVPGLTVQQFAEKTGISTADLIKKLFMLGVMANINHSLDEDSIMILADEYQLNIEIGADNDNDDEPEESLIDTASENLTSRPPVVTVMGHVNHGKTTLLDTIRKSQVVDTESGGITQHVGAYMVKHNEHEICFIDTPGHAAFSGMRSMGANVTDIVILIVAANDGIQPQTLESIQHAKEAEVPLIIAINKIDVEGANSDKIKGDLANIGLTPEDWGGDYLCVEISALKGDGIDDLLDAVNLQAELLELKANPKGKAFGIVLESCQTDQQGPLVTVLIKNGTFKVGDPLVSGHVFGKIRRMENDRGQIIKKVLPSHPVRIFGFTEVPDVSSRVKIFDNEKEARQVAREKSINRRAKNLQKNDAVTIENLYETIQAESKKEFKIIIKADVAGSINALETLFGEFNSDKISLQILQTSTGAVTENDIMFAAAYDAVILAYRVKVTNASRNLIRQQKVTLLEYEVIYHAYEKIKEMLEGQLDKEYEEIFVGVSDVKKTFRIGGVGVIAGCLVSEGKVLKNCRCRIKRNGKFLEDIECEITTLKHYKDEVNEVRMGAECGIALSNFTDYNEGDKLHFFVLEEKKTSL